MQDYILLSKDTRIANIIEGKLEPVLPDRLPLLLQRTGDYLAWLESRAIDRSRVNSRLLKKALRLGKKDDINTVLAVNAATITDNFWVKPIDDTETTYADIRFTMNRFDNLALTGDVNAFDQPPSRTPELTNTGSFEKCWRLVDGQWWMAKAGRPEELYSELLSYHLGKLLKLPIAEYRANGAFILSRDFTDGAKVDFEPAAALIGDESDYLKIYEALKPFGEAVTHPYMRMCSFDALVLNMDRHEHNFGVLRDSETGAVLSLAPLFDHNIALVSRGYPRNITAVGDRLIQDFAELLQHVGKPIALPKLSRGKIERCMNKIPWELPQTDDVTAPRQFVVEYLSNRQKELGARCKDLLILRVPQRERELER